MDAVVTAGITRCAKFQPNRHHQQNNSQLLTGRMPLLFPNNSVKSIEGIQYIKKYISTLFNSATFRIQTQKLVPWGTDGRLPLSDLDLDLGSGHTAYGRASLIDLYLRTKLH